MATLTAKEAAMVDNSGGPVETMLKLGTHIRELGTVASGKFTALAANRSILLKMGDFKIASDANATAFANTTELAGGALGANSDPSMQLDPNEGMFVKWGSGATPVPIIACIALPADFDGSSAVVVKMNAKASATGSAGFSLGLNWDRANTKTVTSGVLALAAYSTYSLTSPATSVNGAVESVNVLLKPLRATAVAMSLSSIRIDYVGLQA